MSLRHPLSIGLVGLSFLVLPFVAGMQPAQAQPVAASAPPPGVGPRIKPPPRLQTPSEKRAVANGTADDETRPEGAVKPQLSIPFGKKPAQPTDAQVRAVRPAASATGVDDGAAACDSEIGAQARSACRVKRGLTQ